MARSEKERQMQAMTLTRRRALKGAAGGLLGTVLAAPARRSTARQDTVTLRWWDYYAEGANAIAMQNQLQRYIDANPSVTIERTPIPFADLKQKLLQGAAAGELPDVAVIDNPDHQAFAALGILEDLTERVAAWGQADAYFAGPWDSTIW
jgi:multiple sugar transport system substrate-binding protein